MIVTAIQKGGSVYVYGERNRLLFTQSGELHGYTGSSVLIKREIWFIVIMNAVRLYLRTARDNKVALIEKTEYFTILVELLAMARYNMVNER